MPIAGVGRVEPMDPVVKREVMRRARESGTFATEPDAAWVGSPLPASVNRRVVSRDATKRPAGPDAPLTSSSHFGATVAPRTLDYDGSGGRGSFSGAAVHPTPSDDAPSPDRVEAFRGMSPTPDSPAGFRAGRRPWGSGSHGVRLAAIAVTPSLGPGARPVKVLQAALQDFGR